MGPKVRLFLILFVAGMAGVLSFLLVDLEALIAALPQPAGSPTPELPPIAILKLIALIQPSVLTSLAVLVGIWLAPQVGLHAPLAEAIAERKPIWPSLGPQIAPGVIAGLASGVAIVLIWLIAKPNLPGEFITRAVEFNKFIPHAVRMLYGGITEELLLRWGVMTFLVWLQWRILLRKDIGGIPDQPPPTIIFIVAILVSAILFGVGHLPAASLLAGGLTLPIAIYVVAANSIFGIVAGLLYWRRGLESAILAHMFAHVVLIAAIHFGL